MATTAYSTPTIFHFTRTFTPSQQLEPPCARASYQRPNLSLNTSPASPSQTRHKRTPTLRLDTSAAGSSPNMRNTYKFAYGSSQPGRSASVPAVVSLLAPESQAEELANSQPSSRPTSEPSIHAPDEIPYVISPCTRSILSNSPHTRGERGRQKTSQKKVCFRDPIAEDIFTTQYLAKHSDLRSRSNSPALPAGSGLQMTPLKTPSSTKHPTPRVSEMAAPRQRHHEDNHSSAREKQADPVLAKTPTASRQARSDWTWAVPAVPGAWPAAPSTSFSPPDLAISDSDSEEDLAASLGESVAAAGAFHLGMHD